MNPAKYDKRITFQKKDRVQDKEGNWVTDWVDHETVWAKIKHLRGKEIISAGANSVKITTRIYIRYRKGVTDGMRIKFKDDRYFKIEFLNNLEEQNVEYEILVNEVRSNG
ncbi:head-tail adaptor protein [Virgibacillus phage Mimir87]|nr:head-tail adaptor protein [Virgibacillus phage Mimir87]